MAEAPRDAVAVVPAPDLDRQRQELAELAAARAELAGAVARQVALYVEHFGKTPQEAAAEALADAPADSPFDPAARPADQVGWWEVERAVRRDPAQGQALWRHVKAEASQELLIGYRAARTLEQGIDGRPWDRARFLAVVDGLAEALRPRDALERLLVHQMASAYELHLRWQVRAVQRMEEEVWRGERDKRRQLEEMSPARRGRYRTTAWMPPRLSDAEAVEQAALIADRYQRSFLRLLKAFRDTRRVIGSVVVGEGGTLNVAEGPQQVNVHPPKRSPRGRAAGPRAPRSRAPRRGRARPDARFGNGA